MLPSEFTDTNDLVNLDQRCIHCQSKEVVYYIAVPTVGFPQGAYCYGCLLQHCRMTHRIPIPIEVNLQKRLEIDLGIIGKKKVFMGMDRKGG